MNTTRGRAQAERLVSAAGEKAKQWAADLRTKSAPALAELRAKSAPALAELQAKGLPVLKRYVALVGAPTLIALVALLFGWFFLAAVSIDIFGERQSATFYDYLRILNNPQNGLVALEGGRTGTGWYGLLALGALLAPLLPHVVKSRRLRLAYCAPAAFMVLAGVMGWWKMRSATSQATNAAGSFGGGELQQMASGMARELVNEIWNAISIGLGAYLSAAAAIYLVAVGIRRYRAG
jgi:hypothetical protein